MWKTTESNLHSDNSINWGSRPSPCSYDGCCCCTPNSLDGYTHIGIASSYTKWHGRNEIHACIVLNTVCNVLRESSKIGCLRTQYIDALTHTHAADKHRHTSLEYRDASIRYFISEKIAFSGQPIRYFVKFFSVNIFTVCQFNKERAFQSKSRKKEWKKDTFLSITNFPRKP